MNDKTPEIMKKLIAPQWRIWLLTTMYLLHYPVVKKRKWHEEVWRVWLAFLKIFDNLGCMTVLISIIYNVQR